MFGYMTDLSKVEEKYTETVCVEGDWCQYMCVGDINLSISGHDLESLLFNFLDELLFQFSADLFFVPKVIKEFFHPFFPF